ncbi:hypothetical protein RSOL_322400, partial [Rhizoctonia solani AG-3 Rhs1AP]
MFTTFNNALRVAREQRTMRSELNTYFARFDQLQLLLFELQDDSPLLEEVAASAAVSLLQLGFSADSWQRDRILGAVDVVYTCGAKRQGSMQMSHEIPDMLSVYALKLSEGVVSHVLALEGEILAEWALGEAEQDRLVLRAQSAGVHLIIVSVGGTSNENSLMFLSALGKILPDGGSLTFIRDQDIADSISAHIANSGAPTKTPASRQEHILSKQAETHKKQPNAKAAAEGENDREGSKCVSDKDFMTPEAAIDMLSTYEVLTNQELTISHVLWRFLCAAREQPQVHAKGARFTEMKPLFDVQEVVENSLNQLSPTLENTMESPNIKFSDGLEVAVSKDENLLLVQSDAMPEGNIFGISIVDFYQKAVSPKQLEHLQNVYDAMTSSLEGSKREIIQDGLARIKEFNCKLGSMLKPLRGADTEPKYEMAEALLIRNALYDMVETGNSKHSD